MQIITKKISLEPYKSRINGSLTSFDGEDVVTFSDYRKLDIRHNNYGLFPKDVICYDGKILSYPTLMERYHFCKRYKEMLKYDNCEDGGFYDNAITYYTHNFTHHTESLKKEYEDLDAIYAEYGGDVFFNWCESILYGGNVNYSETAHILIPILFTNTIDDMGEFSIFCDDWEAGEEYTKDSLSIYDEKVWIKYGTDYGSIYSDRYKELYFPQISGMPHDENYQWYEKSGANISYSKEQWKDYTDEYFLKTDTKYSKKIQSGTTYTNRNGKVFYNAHPKNDIAYKYDIIKNNELGFYIINNEIFEPYKTEYINYNNEYIFVYDADNFVQLNEKYCYVKGQKIYSKTKEDGYSHYFLIDGDEYNVEKDGLFISYKGIAYKINNNIININGINYPKIDSYAIINGKNYFISSNKIVTLTRDNNTYSLNDTLVTDLGVHLSDFNSKSSGYTIDGDIVYVLKPYNEYSVETMSGYTESKLSSFESYHIAYDDMGNKLPGALVKNADGTYKTPKEKDYLDLPYRVGNVSDLSVMEYDTDGKTPKTFFGNILTSIIFYYVDYYDNIIEDTKVECGLNDSLLEKINECKDKLKTFKKGHAEDNYISEKHYYIKDEIRCNIKYHMGAIIQSDLETIQEDGIVYEEEVKLVDKTFDYMYDEFSSCIIHYYEFEYNDMFDEMNEYSNDTCKVGKAYFSFKIDDLISDKQKGYRAKHDGMIAAPVFREEYKFGSSSLENIESNIYIDRGFSASYEKHLKLLDVKSMEALENMGNGFYNIIES